MKQYLVLIALLSGAAASFAESPAATIHLAADPPAAPATSVATPIASAATKAASPTAAPTGPRRLTPEERAQLRRQLYQYRLAGKG